VASDIGKGRIGNHMFLLDVAENFQAGALDVKKTVLGAVTPMSVFPLT